MSGFATPTIRDTPKPRYLKTVVCERCHAEFNPDTQWVFGYYEEGTSSTFNTLGHIKRGACPVCRWEGR